MTGDVKVIVLVADDDEGIRDTTAAILRCVGYTVVEVQDGEAALAELAITSFTVAVLDVRMPKRDGISVVETLDPEPPPPVILMASAYDFSPELRDQLSPRVFKYLKKPVPPSLLIEAVHEAARGLEP
ncbi:MAG TPA: response regulator [Acidimicrobiales bacterium]|nr:response regulator [Acidimicrobiales bacterium]